MESHTSARPGAAIKQMHKGEDIRGINLRGINLDELSGLYHFCGWQQAIAKAALPASSEPYLERAEYRAGRAGLYAFLILQALGIVLVKKIIDFESETGSLVDFVAG